MPYDFSQLKKRLPAVEDWLAKELAGIRTGRATPLLLDNILIETYGAKTALKHIANIAVEDARTLRVTPWDNSQVKTIETAIAAANLGVSTVPDTAGVRVIFPELTAERREQLLKLVGQKLEEARISLRQERDEVWSDIQRKEKNHQLSEDEKFKYKNELQKLLDEAGKKIGALAAKKEQEIKS